MHLRYVIVLPLTNKVSSSSSINHMSDLTLLINHMSDLTLTQ